MLRKIVGGVVLAVALKTSGAAESPNAAPEPSELAPMTVGVALSQDHVHPGEKISVLGTVRLLPGWHTYATVPVGKPYIQTRWSIDPPSGVTEQGDWITPPATPDPRDPDLTIYEGDALSFSHPVSIAANASGEQTIRVGIVFQTCNLERCLPPARKSFDLKLAVGASKP